MLTQQPVLLEDVLIGRTKPYERYLLRHLMDVGPCRLADLVDALYMHREDGGPLGAKKIVQVAICHLRRALRRGWKILTHGTQDPLYELRYEGTPC